MRTRGCAAILSLLGVGLFHVSWAVVAGEQVLRDLTEPESKEWKEITDTQLTPDGRWLVYGLVPYDETVNRPVTVVVKSTSGEIERRYDAGSSCSRSFDIQLSASGEWLAFRMGRAGGEDPCSAETTKPSSGDLATVSVIEVASGNRTDFAGARSFAFSGGKDPWIALKTDVKASGCEQSSLERRRGRAGAGSYLTLRRLGTIECYSLGDAVNFAFDAGGRYLAWSDSGSLHVRVMQTGKARILDATRGASYRDMTWSPKGNLLAVLRVGTSEKTAPSNPDLLVLSDFSDRSVTKREFSPPTWQRFPAGYAISLQGPDIPQSFPIDPAHAPSLTWRADEKGLLFGIRPIPKTFRTPADTPAALPVIWRSQDTYLPGDKQTTQVGQESSFLSLLSLPEGRFVQLADASLPFVAIHDRGQYLLGRDTRLYERERNITGRIYQDWYLVDIKTGVRVLLYKRFLRPAYTTLGLSSPTLSPDGTVALYQDLGSRGDYVAVEVMSRKRRNLTEQLKVQFYHAESLKWRAHALENLGYLLQGWTRDGRYVLVSDYWDVWALPLREGAPVNLTGNGRQSGIQYVRTDFQALPGEKEISAQVDLRQPIYFRTVEAHRRRTGLAVLAPGMTEAKILHSDEAEIRYFKAAGSNAYIGTFETAVRYADYYSVDATWKAAQQLTDANPQQREFRWSPGAKVLSYTTASGEPGQGLLHLPAGYTPGASYPTIVTVYNVDPEGWHNYRWPYRQRAWVVLHDIPYWTQRGYAVLKPDVPGKILHLGEAAVDAVVAAAQAGIASGVVDKDRMALTGFSWGGFVTAFVISHTSLFKAAVVHAGVTDWTSQCGIVIARTGVPQSGHCETHTYMAEPLWQSWDVYAQNSPISHVANINTPLLIAHGDADASVQFSDSVRLFNALRQQGKPAVLLQYPGEGHVFARPEVVQDLLQRQEKFLDHFLKRTARPQWWPENAVTFSRAGQSSVDQAAATAVVAP